MINKESGVSNTKKSIVACIDLESSYFRLLVADCFRMDGLSELTPLLEERIFIGWGRCLQEDGVITPGAGCGRGLPALAGGKLSFLPPGGESPKIIFTGGTAHVVARDLRWAVIARENGRIDTR